MDCCLLKATNSCLHKYYFYHQNSTLHFSKVAHPIVESLLMLFGQISTKCHLQLETSGCWIALTFFPPSARAGRDSSQRSSVVRGTGSAGTFSFMAICLHSSSGICQNVSLQTSHIWKKKGFVMVGAQPSTAAVCGFFLCDGDDTCLLGDITAPQLLADDDHSLV